MAEQEKKAAARFRSIAGGALVGLGLHVLMGSVGRVESQWNHLLGAKADGALGLLPSAVLAASEAVQSYACDHQTFVLGLAKALLSLWPLLLIAGGTILLHDALADTVGRLPARVNYFSEPACPMSISPFVIRRIDRAQVQALQARQIPGSQSNSHKEQ